MKGSWTGGGGGGGGRLDISQYGEIRQRTPFLEDILLQSLLAHLKVM